MSRTAARPERNLEELVRQDLEGAYEALQLYKSRVNRLLKKKNFADALTESANGACVLLSHSYSKAGLELANQVIQILEYLNQDLDDNNKCLIYRINDNFSKPCEEQVEYLENCLKWFVKVSSRELGDPELHRKLGITLWEIGSYVKSAYHLAICENPDLILSKVF